MSEGSLVQGLSVPVFEKEYLHEKESREIALFAARRNRTAESGRNKTCCTDTGDSGSDHAGRRYLWSKN